eukprot:6269089-Alexandrium_andersonii.AAC.1
MPPVVLPVAARPRLGAAVVRLRRGRTIAAARSRRRRDQLRAAAAAACERWVAACFWHEAA